MMENEKNCYKQSGDQDQKFINCMHSIIYKYEKEIKNLEFRMAYWKH